MMNALIVLQTITLAGGERVHFALVMNVLILETNALNVRVQASAPHSRASLENATHRNSPSKTGGSHALVLTCEYATPTSYIP